MWWILGKWMQESESCAFRVLMKNAHASGFLAISALQGRLKKGAGQWALKSTVTWAGKIFSSFLSPDLSALPKRRNWSWLQCVRLKRHREVMGYSQLPQTVQQYLYSEVRYLQPGTGGSQGIKTKWCLSRSLGKSPTRGACTQSNLWFGFFFFLASWMYFTLNKWLLVSSPTGVSVVFHISIGVFFCVLQWLEPRGCSIDTKDW